MELFNQDGLTQTELVQLIDVEQPTLVRTLDRMERDRFIIRTPSPTDRRAVHIHLTDKAKSNQDALALIANQLNEQALAGFTAQEQNELGKYINRIAENLKFYAK